MYSNQICRKLSPDIVPALCDGHNGYGRILVPDLDANLALEHPTTIDGSRQNPLGYAQWFETRCIVIDQLIEKYAKAQVDPILVVSPHTRNHRFKRVCQQLNETLA